MALRRPGYASKISITYSARTCTSIIAAGIQFCVTAAGRRLSRRPSIFFTKANMPRGRSRTKRGENRAGGGGNVWRYNCEPVVQAGQALLVDDDYQLDDTFWLTPTPGHSPHHCCVNIRSRGQHAVVIGDRSEEHTELQSHSE